MEVVRNLLVWIGVILFAMMFLIGVVATASAAKNGALKYPTICENYQNAAECGAVIRGE